MIEHDADIVVIGAGFGGSLAALVAQRIGRSVVLIDRGRHPRFAIGESSTPMANLVLESLADRYNLPRLKPLANYASWKAAYPQIGVGLKRGFSYFHHQAGKEWQATPHHETEFLVAASHGPDDADTHWLRSDFDAFIAGEAVAAGIPYHDQTTLTELERHGDGWQLRGERLGEPVQLTARFLVDASGEAGFLARQLGLRNTTDRLRTHSRAVFSHFEHVALWEPLAAELGCRSDEHPYPCDDAALHHVFDGGWMYVLRFDHGVTSAGFCLDPRKFPVPDNVSPDDEWRSWLDRFPSVARQFRKARVVRGDAGRMRRSGRMQRSIEPAAGLGFALLPNAAGFLDPLHSTGNAHTVIGIERLARIWDEHWQQPTETAALAEYAALVRAEFSFIDGIIAGSYAGFRNFESMIAVSLFYFATAIWSEHRRREGRNVPRAFLCADDESLHAALQTCIAGIHGHASRVTRVPMDVVREAIRDWDLAGLCDPSKRNLFPYPKQNVE